MTDKGLAIHEAKNRLEIVGERVPYPRELDAGTIPRAAVAVALPGLLLSPRSPLPPPPHQEEPSLSSRRSRGLPIPFRARKVATPAFPNRASDLLPSSTHGATATLLLPQQLLPPQRLRPWTQRLHLPPPPMRVTTMREMQWQSMPPQPPRHLCPPG